MADVAEAAGILAEEAESIKFGGTQRNLVPGMALLLAGVSAFFMNMTDFFPVEVIAWVIVIGGLLWVYIGLADIYESFEVTEEALLIHDSMRPWRGSKQWDWAHINQLDVVTHREDSRLSDATMQIYFTVDGEPTVLCEDRGYDHELAQLIINHAELKPTGSVNLSELATLPLQNEATYTWQ